MVVVNWVAVRNVVAMIAFVIALFWAIASAKAEAARKPPAAICAVFRTNCAEALRVSWCESRWSTSARNGQYLGLFQMGSWERRTFGHGPDAYSQARAAYRYFVATDKTWRPWSCRWAA